MFRNHFIIQCVFWSFAVFSVTSSRLSYAGDSVAIIERPDDELMILGLDVNGYLRTEGIEAYLPSNSFNNNILLPLGILSEALSVSIIVDPTEGLAEGFFLEEDKTFQLDMKRGQVIFAGQVHDLPKEGVEAHIDDIYVALPLLETWFDLDITFQSFTLVLDIKSKIPFPFQDAEDRQKRSEKYLTSNSRKEDFDSRNAYFLPYGYFSRPNFVLQESLTGTKTSTDSSYQVTSNIQAGFDLMKFGANLNLTHTSSKEDSSEIKNASFTLSRSDPKREMLGSLKAGRINIGDISFPDVGLISGGGRGSGILVSSEADFGYKFSQQLGVITIDGDAPVNWDVEIYRNGQFIGFETVDTDARFKFEDIQLISGFNRFQILLFGPEGQERTVTRDIFSGPHMLSEGVLKYEFAAGRPEADFLPFAENSQENKDVGIGGEILYGVNNFLTVGGNVYSGPDDGSTSRAASLSLSAAYLGVNLQLEGAYANRKRKVFRTSVRKRFLGIHAAATHTRYKNFDTDDENKESSTEISLSKNIGRVNVTLVADKETFIDEEDRIRLESIVSSNIGNLRFTNQLTKTISKNESVDDLEGELSVFADVNDFRFRSSLTYDLDSEAKEKLGVLRISTQKKIGKRDSLRVTSNYSFPTNILSFDTRYSREFDPVTLDFNLGGSSDQSYFAGITARVSLQPREDGYKFVPSRIGTLSTLGVRAFIDQNGNFIFDENEKIIEDVVFVSTRSATKAKTEENGVGWFYGLSEIPTKVSVDIEEIPSIYIMPAKKALELIPRRGTNFVVDFPFTQFGEIDGFVLDKESEKYLSNITVKIIDTETGNIVSEVQSESDGFFVFSALPLGKYKVIASSAWFEEGTPETDVVLIDLTSDESGVFGLGLEIVSGDNIEADNHAID